MGWGFIPIWWKVQTCVRNGSLFLSRNMSIGILFHPKIYETLSKVFRLPCMNDHIRG